MLSDDNKNGCKLNSKAFHVRRKTEKIRSPLSGCGVSQQVNSSTISKPLTARTITISKKRESVGMSDRGNFLYLGNNGDANVLQSPDFFSSTKSGKRGHKSYRQTRKDSTAVHKTSIPKSSPISPNET